MTLPADYQVRFSGPTRWVKAIEFVDSLPPDSAGELKEANEVVSVKLKRTVHFIAVAEAPARTIPFPQAA